MVQTMVKTQVKTIVITMVQHWLNNSLNTSLNASLNPGHTLVKHLNLWSIYCQILVKMLVKYLKPVQRMGPH